MTNHLGDVTRRRTGVPVRARVMHWLVDPARYRIGPMGALDRNRVVVDVADHEVSGRDEAPRRASKTIAKRESHGRERCPADVTASVTPVDPGGSPNRITHPKPPVIVVPHPTPNAEG